MEESLGTIEWGIAARSWGLREGHVPPSWKQLLVLRAGEALDLSRTQYVAIAEGPVDYHCRYA